MALALPSTPPRLNLYEERSRLDEQQLARWQGLPLCWVDASASAFVRGLVNERTVLALLDFGEAEADFDYTQRRVHLNVSAGAMGLFLPGDVRASRWRCRGARRVMVDLDLASCRERGLDTGDFETRSLREDPEFRDPGLANLLRAMAREVEAGCPQGPLYAQSASLALLEVLQSRLGRERAARRERGRLSAVQLAQVDQYIDHNLAGEVSLSALASVVCLSAPHFARPFRNATGSSPHRHVLGKRVQRATELLRYTVMPLPAVAAACGFASQSHMNAVVGAALGASPGQIRRQAGRSDSPGP